MMLSQKKLKIFPLYFHTQLNTNGWSWIIFYRQSNFTKYLQDHLVWPNLHMSSPKRIVSTWINHEHTLENIQCEIIAVEPEALASALATFILVSCSAMFGNSRRAFSSPYGTRLAKSGVFSFHIFQILIRKFE